VSDKDWDPHDDFGSTLHLLGCRGSHCDNKGVTSCNVEVDESSLGGGGKVVNSNSGGQHY
jgi:hypothetical protein